MTKVVAKVADKEIKESDVLQFIEEIGPQVAMQFQSAEGIKTIIQEMINQEILLLDAKENKLNEEEEFKVVLDHTVDNLLKNYAFSKILSKETVSDEEVEKYFEDNKAVFANVAMTGEVTLRGNVLPIGGLKEKTLAAYRSGITKIIIPKKNEKDLHEIPDVVKESMEILAVETMEEVLEGALV